MFWSISPKTGRELYALHCNLELSVTPRPRALITEVGVGKYLGVSTGLPRDN